MKTYRTSIGFRFLYIIAAFLGAFSCAVLYFCWFSSNVQMEVLLEDKAELALQFDLAIRSYVSETVRPFAQEHTDKDVFIPEVMSTSFVARSVFDKVCQEHPDYIIKFSSDNPRNPLNQAGPEELEIIEYFNNNPEAKRWSGKIKMDGQDHVALFSARRMKEKCLQCHGDPKDAPASMVSRYGDKAGFYRPVGEVVALDAVAMPAKKYQVAAAMHEIKTSIVMITGLALLLVTIYYTFHRLVGRKLEVIAEHFKNAAGQDGESIFKRLKFDHKNNDEISTVVKSFNVMVDNLSKSTTSIDNLNAANQQLEASQQQLRAANQQLHADVVERKRVEEQLEIAIHKAESANVAKSRFLANMSHEIRTPMNGIIGFSGILTEEDLTEEQQEYVAIIQDSSENLLNLINDILDFSKVEAGEMEIDKISFSLEDLLVKVESLMSPTAAEKGLDFKLNKCKDLPDRIVTDPVRLRQCLLNLIGNAIKFTEKGHVYLNVSLQTNDNNKFIRFDIEDTGIGIPQDKQDSVFKAFAQADGSTTRQYGGTGLGLSITKQLVELLGGKISLSSQECKGSVFSFVIAYDDHSKLNCWEFYKCGRQLGGEKTEELGVCPVATDVSFDRINGGKNAGRRCWRVTGTLCKGDVQGTYAMKLGNCLECDFFNIVHEQESSTFAR